MTLSNLPPGVAERMIPGNRPEDELDDYLWDKGEDYRRGYYMGMMGELDMDSPGYDVPRAVIGWIDGAGIYCDELEMENILRKSEEAQMIEEWAREDEREVYGDGATC